jgi:peptide/nickel transport system permease protein
MTDVLKRYPIPQQTSQPTPLRPIMRGLAFWRRRGGIMTAFSLLLLIVIVAAVLLADVLAPHNPTALNLRARLTPPFTEAAHPLGTDASGRDILSRILHGGRVSLAVSLSASFIGLVLGTALGMVSGFLRGWVDTLIAYLIDVQLALPFLLLAVSVALVLGTSPGVLIGLAAISTIPIYARVVRGTVLTLREREFVSAARALGGSSIHIIFTHLLPNLAAPLLVLATLNVGRIILLESGLSFLGIGIQPPTPSWGIMINDGREYLSSAWWIATMPGIVLAALSVAVGTLGDWLRDLTDVRLS